MNKAFLSVCLISSAMEVLGEVETYLRKCVVVITHSTLLYCAWCEKKIRFISVEIVTALLVLCTLRGSQQRQSHF